MPEFERGPGIAGDGCGHDGRAVDLRYQAIDRIVVEHRSTQPQFAAAPGQPVGSPCGDGRMRHVGIDRRAGDQRPLEACGLGSLVGVDLVVRMVGQIDGHR